MSKYDDLKDFLLAQETSTVPMTFAEIERVIGQPLPRSSRYPAWWSNNPSNNVMTQVWLDAGFKTEQVNIEARKLVFRRVEHATENVTANPGMTDAGRSFRGPDKASGQPQVSHIVHPAYGAMKGIITLNPGVDLTEPAADPASWKHR